MDFLLRVISTYTEVDHFDVAATASECVLQDIGVDVLCVVVDLQTRRDAVADDQDSKNANVTGKQTA